MAAGRHGWLGGDERLLIPCLLLRLIVAVQLWVLRRKGWLGDS